MDANWVVSRTPFLTSESVFGPNSRATLRWDGATDEVHEIRHRSSGRRIPDANAGQHLVQEDLVRAWLTSMRLGTRTVTITGRALFPTISTFNLT